MNTYPIARAAITQLLLACVQFIGAFAAGRIVLIRLVQNFDQIMPYLTGELYDENRTIEYGKSGRISYRRNVLQNYCAGRDVLHVGCADNIQTINKKIATNNWIHGEITKCAHYTLGVDIDENAVNVASKISGLNNMIVGDITSDRIIEKISKLRFDIAVFSAILEHIPNPVAFLSKFRENYADRIGEIVINAPNAFRAGNIKGIIGNYERINTNSRYFFTPYTLSKVVVDAGFVPDQIVMTTFTQAGPLKSWVLNRKPLLAEDIILLCRATP